MSLIKVLNDIGFEKTEAKIYLATLQLGESPASAIAKNAGIKRPSAYVTLKSLIRRGYITSYVRQHVTKFVALDPKVVVRRSVERAEKAKDVLPELEALSLSTEGLSKPKIEYYEGYNGMVAIMEDTLNYPNSTILGWNDTKLAVETLEDYYPEYISRKNERNIFVKAILIDDGVGKAFKAKGQVEKRQVKLVTREDLPIANEINIYGNNLFIISHKDMIGVIIRNKKVADTQRAIFNLCWKLLPG